MSEGLEILGLINSRRGCMLTDINSELNISINSVNGWISLLCNTGYLKKCEQDHGSSPCKKNGTGCGHCSFSCKTIQANTPVRIEITERGLNLFRGSLDQTGTHEIPKIKERIS